MSGDEIETFFKAPRESKTTRRQRILAVRKSAAVELREEVLMRSHGDCEIGSPVCTGRVEHIHHVKRRGQGGRQHLDDVRGTCFLCHEYVHGHVEESYGKGWLRRRGDDG